MTYKNAYRKVMRDLEKERERAENSRFEQREKIFEKFPRLKEIEQILGNIGLKISRLALGGNLQEINKLRQESDALKKERLSLLGKTHDKYFTLKFNCEKCSDTGFISHHPGNPAEPCSCLKQRLINEYYSMSNMNQVLSDENFDTFDISLFSTETNKNEGLSPRKNMENNHKEALSFVQSFSEKFQNLYLYGEPGLGKTFLCHCIAKDLLNHAHTVLYLTAPRLCKVIENARFNRDYSEPPSEMLDSVDNADLLVLDDFGAETPTSITTAALFDIINQRILTRKPTIISSNFSINDLEPLYSQRFTSRFFGFYEPLKFFGDDIRVKKKRGGFRM